MAKSALAYTCFAVSLTATPNGFCNDLVIPTGQMKTIETQETDLRLDRLRLEDGAVIRFAPGVSRWQVHAREAWIGSNVRIEGNGRNGALPKGGSNSGKASQERAAACATGAKGISGIPGGSGEKGVDITLHLGLVHFGSMTVESNGGNGATGGTGEPGQAGGEEDGCHAGSGGKGGAGGNGGDGGAGGDIRIVYWSANQTAYIPVSNYGPGIHLENLGGDAGEPGMPGKGGAGGKGGWSKRGSGKVISRESGERGKNGRPGSPGDSGKSGRFLIQPVARPSAARH